MEEKNAGLLNTNKVLVGLSSLIIVILGWMFITLVGILKTISDRQYDQGMVIATNTRNLQGLKEGQEVMRGFILRQIESKLQRFELEKEKK